MSDIKFYHPCFYTGDEIEIQLSVDECGLFKFTAIHSDSGEAVDFEAEKPYSMGEEALAQANRRISAISE